MIRRITEMVAVVMVASSFALVAAALVPQALPQNALVDAPAVQATAASTVLAPGLTLGCPFCGGGTPSKGEDQGEVGGVICTDYTEWMETMKHTPLEPPVVTYHP